MKRPRVVILAALAAAAAGPVAAVDWPLPSPVVIGTFGEDRGDHFSSGIDLTGPRQPVHPALDGELVFRYGGAGDYSSLPRGTGAIVVLRHAQDLLSVYTHLAEGSLGPSRTTYAARDSVGDLGDSGRAEGPLLRFSVYDGETRAWVNPLSFLPLAVDRQPPVIRRVLLAVGDQRQELAPGARVRQGKAAVLVEAWDLREDVRFSWPLAPYAVLLSLDGTQVARITFDTLSAPQGEMLLGPSLLRRSDLYAGGGLLRAGTVDLRPGDSHILVAVRDFAGNEAARDITVTVVH